MEIRGHEVPTVFVRGHAPPAVVRAAEEHLRSLCEPFHTISYSALWIDSDARSCTVEVDLQVAGETIGCRGTGPTVQDATDACFDLLAAALGGEVDVTQ